MPNILKISIPSRRRSNHHDNDGTSRKSFTATLRKFTLRRTSEIDRGATLTSTSPATTPVINDGTSRKILAAIRRRLRLRRTSGNDRDDTLTSTLPATTLVITDTAVMVTNTNHLEEVEEPVSDQRLDEWGPLLAKKLDECELLVAGNTKKLDKIELSLTSFTKKLDECMLLLTNHIKTPDEFAQRLDNYSQEWDSSHKKKPDELENPRLEKSIVSEKTMPAKIGEVNDSVIQVETGGDASPIAATSISPQLDLFVKGNEDTASKKVEASVNRADSTSNNFAPSNSRNEMRKRKTSQEAEERDTRQNKLSKATSKTDAESTSIQSPNSEKEVHAGKMGDLSQKAGGHDNKEKSVPSVATSSNIAESFLQPPNSRNNERSSVLMEEREGSSQETKAYGNEKLPSDNDAELRLPEFSSDNRSLSDGSKLAGKSVTPYPNSTAVNHTIPTPASQQYFDIPSSQAPHSTHTSGTEYEQREIPPSLVEYVNGLPTSDRWSNASHQFPGSIGKLGLRNQPQAQILEKSTKVERKPLGLRNLGNTCWVNSAVQLLQPLVKLAYPDHVQASIGDPVLKLLYSGGRGVGYETFLRSLLNERPKIDIFEDCQLGEQNDASV
ncbi:hypothetical protein BC938DRAFT_480100, partial [Jimgerdemannia flammicorona]